jgi:hypothetical protein
MSLRAMGRFIGTQLIRTIGAKRGNALEWCDLFESLGAASRVAFYRHLIGRGECEEQQQDGPSCSSWHGTKLLFVVASSSPLGYVTGHVYQHGGERTTDFGRRTGVVYRPRFARLESEGF